MCPCVPSNGRCGATWARSARGAPGPAVAAQIADLRSDLRASRSQLLVLRSSYCPPTCPSPPCLRLRRGLQAHRSIVISTTHPSVSLSFHHLCSSCLSVRGSHICCTSRHGVTSSAYDARRQRPLSATISDHDPLPVPPETTECSCTHARLVPVQQPARVLCRPCAVLRGAVASRKRCARRSSISSHSQATHRATGLRPTAATRLPLDPNLSSPLAHHGLPDSCTSSTPLPTAMPPASSRRLRAPTTGGAPPPTPPPSHPTPCENAPPGIPPHRSGVPNSYYLTTSALPLILP